MPFVSYSKMSESISSQSKTFSNEGKLIPYHSSTVQNQHAYSAPAV